MEGRGAEEETPDSSGRRDTRRRDSVCPRDPISHLTSQMNQEPAIFSVKGQIVNILGFGPDGLGCKYSALLFFS